MKIKSSLTITSPQLISSLALTLLLVQSLMILGCDESPSTSSVLPSTLHQQAATHPSTSPSTALTQVDLEQRSDPIQGGFRDNERTYVVGLAIQHGWSGGACSGTLIAPNLVLTAQHCVASLPTSGILCGSSQFGAPYGPSDVYVTTETELPQNSFGYIGVQEILLPSLRADVCGNDIALLILNRNINSSLAMPIVPRLDEPIEAGELFTAVGYGHTGNGQGAGIRRTITNRYVICSGQNNGCQDGNQGVYENEWVGNNGTCEGDSGGPAIDEEGYVLGALSRGAQGCEYPVYSGVWGWREWIRETAERAARAGGYPLPEWVNGVAGNPPSDVDADEIFDDVDNCVDVSNPLQQDMDRDGIGDLCDPLVSYDRGGMCSICNTCDVDSDCAGEEEACLEFQTGKFCALPCLGSFQCPDTTSCISVTFDEKVCLNQDIEEVGLCPAEYICGGPRGLSPPPEDDDTCHVCQPCETSRECMSGLCADLGGSGKVCSRACEQDEDCRVGSICGQVGGQRLCINVDYNDVGICPEDYICGVSNMSEEMMNQGGDETSVQGGGDAGAEEAGLEGSGGSTQGGSDAGLFALVDDDTKEGCQTSVTPLSPASLILLISLGIYSRRRLTV